MICIIIHYICTHKQKVERLTLLLTLQSTDRQTVLGASFANKTCDSECGVIRIKVLKAPSKSACLGESPRQRTEQENDEGPAEKWCPLASYLSPPPPLSPPTPFIPCPIELCLP